MAHGRAAEEECGNPPEETDSVAGTTGVVEAAAGRVGEDVCVGKPVLEGAAGEVGGEFGDQQGAEVGVFALAKDLPDVGVVESGKRGDFEFEQVVLCWVKVDGVHAGGTLHQVGEDVVAGAGDG